MSNPWAIHSRPQRAHIIPLLEAAGLPTADLTDDAMKDFFYVGSAATPLAVVGVQLFGVDALLRSLVVSPDHRTLGLGRRLVAHAEQHARNQGATTVYLLTTTAESFFLARGYVVAARDGAPSAIRATPEFSGLCPASSAFLTKRL